MDAAAAALPLPLPVPIEFDLDEDHKTGPPEAIYINSLLPGVYSAVGSLINEVLIDRAVVHPRDGRSYTAHTAGIIEDINRLKECAANYRAQVQALGGVPMPFPDALNVENL